MVMAILAPYLEKFGLEVVPPLPTKLDCLFVGLSSIEADDLLASWRVNPKCGLVRNSRLSHAPFCGYCPSN